METLTALWIGCAIGVGVGAARMGRNGVGWALLALLISPLLGVIFLAIAGTVKEEAAAAPDAPTPLTHVRCPDCRELVLKEARLCKHCHCKLVPQ